MFKKIFFIIVVGFLIFSFQNVDAAGLVPCGGTGEDPCTVCHLILGINGVIQFLRNLLVIVGLFIITVAGIIWVVSSGDSGLVSKAKNAIKNTLVGIVLVMAAWLIVVFVLNLISAKDIQEGEVSLVKTGTWSFTCSTTSYIGGEGASSGAGSEVACGSSTGSCSAGKPTRDIYEGLDNKIHWGCVSEDGENTITCTEGQSGSGGTSSTSGNVSEQTARDNLIKQSGNTISIWESGAGRTNIRDLRSGTVNGLLNFQKESGLKNIIVTGGAEAGYHSSGIYSHENGYKIDLEDTKSVNKYIEDNYKYLGERSDGAKVYNDGKGNYYAKEGTHWDVCYGCTAPRVK